MSENVYTLVEKEGNTVVATCGKLKCDLIVYWKEVLHHWYVAWTTVRSGQVCTGARVGRHQQTY